PLDQHLSEVGGVHDAVAGDVGGAGRRGHLRVRGRGRDEEARDEREQDGQEMCRGVSWMRG
ncbi:MAG: hypothetical protein ACO38I_10495, partial [Ilumatobacteraceae bacterium]